MISMKINLEKQNKKWVLIVKPCLSGCTSTLKHLQLTQGGKLDLCPIKEGALAFFPTEELECDNVKYISFLLSSVETPQEKNTTKKQMV